MNGSFEQELTILIIGFDPYSDVWPYFDYFFLKNWPNCPFRKIFVSSTAPFASNCGIENVKTNGDLSVSGRVLCGLKSVTTKKVLLLLEDYILLRSPSDAELMSLLPVVDDCGYSFFQLQNLNDESDGKRHSGFNLKNIRSISSNRKNYRLNMQPSIWNADLLKRICSNKLDKPWDFEVSLCEGGSNFQLNVSQKAGRIFNGPLRCTGFIEKGKYTLKAKSMIMENHLRFPNRPFLTKREQAKFRLGNFLSLHCPYFLKKFGKFIGRKFGVHYFAK